MKMTLLQYHFFALALLFAPLSKATSPVVGKAPVKMGDAFTSPDGETTIPAGMPAPETTAPAADSAEPKPTAPKMTIDYKDPLHFMKDFLDVSKKQEKSLKYWAAQLIILLKPNAGLTGFCNTIKTIALTAKDMPHEQRAKKVNDAFLHAYMDKKFSKEFSDFILAQGLVKVKEAVKMRTAKP